MFRPGNPTPEGDNAEEAKSLNGRSQPRPEEDESTRTPSAAERIRTLIEGNSSGALVVPGLSPVDPAPMMPEKRSITPTGDVLLFPAGSPAVLAAAHADGDGLPAVLEITDVAPVAVPHRIRGRAWLRGWLTPVREAAAPEPAGDRARLRLEVVEAALDDLWGACCVDPGELATALPDPLAGQETELLQHLAAAHGQQVRWLCALACGRQQGQARCAAPRDAVPLALDRFGLRVRFSGDGGAFDARFEFPEPLRGHADLHRAMHTLFEAAYEAYEGYEAGPER